MEYLKVMITFNQDIYSCFEEAIVIRERSERVEHQYRREVVCVDDYSASCRERLVSVLECR